MTFKDFNIRITRDPILRKLLPLQLRRTFPWFRVEGTALCASFAGFRIVREGTAVKAFDPAYYLKVTYPQCALWSFERLPLSANSRIMAPHTPEEIESLAALCNTVLGLWDEASADLEPAILAYNARLMGILEPAQIAVLEKFTNR